jgi:hypothetical protein
VLALGSFSLARQVPPRKRLCVKKKGYPTNTGGAIDFEKRLPCHIGAAFLADGKEFGETAVLHIERLSDQIKP